jgi:hypothetical protein
MSKKRGETKMVDIDEMRARQIEQRLNGKPQEVSVIVTGTQPRPRSRTFTAKPCSVCTALREPDTNFTRVYATRDRVRYCKCTYCNNTWKDSDG